VGHTELRRESETSRKFGKRRYLQRKKNAKAGKRKIQDWQRVAGEEKSKKGGANGRVPAPGAAAEQAQEIREAARKKEPNKEGGKAKEPEAAIIERKVGETAKHR